MTFDRPEASRLAEMRDAMVDSQLRPNGVTDPALIAAFEGVDRDRFVPDARAAFAYHDEEIELAPGRFLMAPMPLGKLLGAADIRPGERVLIIGGGTGYSAAICAGLGAVVTLVEEQEMADRAADALGDSTVEIVAGPLSGGADGADPFDLMIVEGMVEHLPDALTAQVKDGGRIVTVIVDDGVARGGVAKVYGGHLGWTFFMDADAPVLPGFAKKREFVF
ncbi:MAG: protein-L-isoaspartate O-methyltransferase [Pseudomonadota bacterium]